jgi:hypothetical protein
VAPPAPHGPGRPTGYGVGMQFRIPYNFRR